MILKTKNKVLVDEKAYKGVVSNYFNFLRSNSISLDEFEISELLRYSLCVSLGLETKGFNTFIEDFSKGYVKLLRKELKQKGVLNQTDEYKKGFLEACIHCIEFSRKKVGV